MVAEQQPVSGKIPDPKTTKLEPVQTVFGGAVIGNVFMAPRLPEDPSVQAEIENNIRAHRS